MRTTRECIEFLVREVGGHSSDWKRQPGNPRRFGRTTARGFENTHMVKTVTVFETDGEISLTCGVPGADWFFAFEGIEPLITPLGTDWQVFFTTREELWDGGILPEDEVLSHVESTLKDIGLGSTYGGSGFAVAVPGLTREDVARRLKKYGFRPNRDFEAALNRTSYAQQEE